MTLSASLFCLLASVTPSAPPVAETLAARVTACVAERWSVPLAQVRLEWGRASLEPPAASAAKLRLVGRGSGGWFVVALGDGGRDGAAIRVRAGVAETLAVAAHALNPGATLTAKDVRTEVRPHWGPPSALHEAPPGAGFRVRRPIAAGETLAWPAVTPPLLIAAGDPVRLTWGHGGVSVSLNGIALNAARAGERVRAKVDGRSDHVTGVAAAPGIVALDGAGQP